jgi:transposase
VEWGSYLFPAIEAKLMAWHRENECSRRLPQIPAVGPIVAALLTMKTPAPELFRSGHDFAAWIGLTSGIIRPPERPGLASSQVRVTKRCEGQWW